jgi:hypothetical protein
MTADLPSDYLAGLPTAQRERLARANNAGLAALRGYLASGDAVAALDQAESIDHGWAAKADALHARLVPPGLDPDPLATVERLVAAQKAAEQAAPD